MTISKTDIFHVYVGSYGDVEEEAVQVLEFNARDGSLKKVGSVTGIQNPSYLTVNQAQDRLYVVSEVEKGEVVSYSIDKADLKLTEINRQTTKGNGPCYITLDKKEATVFTVNYDEGTMISHTVEQDGSLGKLTNLQLYAEREQSHPHAIVALPGTNKYIVTDLGLGKLYLYEFDDGAEKLNLLKRISAVVGSGPRHVAVEPKMRKLYVVNEFNSKISVYSYDHAVENFELVQEIETVPADYAGENYCADIHVAYEKGYVYASNRGHHSIAVYKILNDGKLSLVEQVPTGGKWPRNFAVVPNEEYMLIANEQSNSIVVMKIADNGTLFPTNNEYIIKAPVCLKIRKKIE